MTALVARRPAELDALGRPVPAVPAGWSAHYEDAGWSTVVRMSDMRFMHALDLAELAGGAHLWLVAGDLADELGRGVLRAPPRALYRAALDPAHPHHAAAAGAVSRIEAGGRLDFQGGVPRLRITVAGHAHVRDARDADGEVTDA